MAITYTATARTSPLQIAVLSGDFTTTSQTAVDVTGLSLSVIAGNYVTCRYDATKSVAATLTASLVYGAGPTTVYTSTTITTSRKTKSFKAQNNDTGSTQTYKTRVLSSDGNTVTIHQSGATPNTIANADTIMLSGAFCTDMCNTAGQVR